MRRFQWPATSFHSPCSITREGESLGTVDGGEGWPVVAITENGTTGPAVGKTSNPCSSD
jgi:hypothetical protein